MKSKNDSNKLIINELAKKMHVRIAFIIQHSIFSIRYSIFLLFCFSTFKATAQTPNFPPPENPTTPPEPLDTTPLTYSFCQNPEQFFPSNDTLPDAQFFEFDPTRRQPLEWATLGNPGSAARPVFFEIEPRTGFQTGLEAFKIYENHPDQLAFFRNRRAFTEVVHTQRGLALTDNQFHGRFARTFDGGGTYSLDYQTLNGAGQYRNQAVKNNSLNTGFWLPVGERYQFFLILSQNNHREQENGGILDPADFALGGLAGGAANIRVRQGDPLNGDPVPISSLRTTEMQLTQHLDFFRKGKSTIENSKKDTVGWKPPIGISKKQTGEWKKDSISEKTKSYPSPPINRNPKSEIRNNLRLSHTLLFSNQTFKYFDKNSAKDSAFYGPFWVDERGLRHFFQTKKLENSLALAFQTRSKKEGREPSSLQIGLSHTFFKLNQEPRDSVFNQFFANGKLAVALSNRLKINALANLGLLKNIGEYSVRGDATLHFGAAGDLRGELIQQRRQPSLLENQLFVNQVSIWRNDFKKLYETTLAATYSIPRLDFSAAGRNLLVNNFIFWNENAAPEQTTQGLNVSQLIVNQDFKWRRWHLENQLVLQKTNQPDLLREPSWMTQNRFYFDGKVFKKRMALTVGADFRMTQAHRADGWSPLAAQFVLQDSTVAAYPSVDFFLAFKVQNFRFFIRADNLTSLVESDIFYQTARYPMPRNYLRLGITFRWLDGKNDKVSTQSSGGSNGNGDGIPSGIRGSSGRRF